MSTHLHVCKYLLKFGFYAYHFQKIMNWCNFSKMTIMFCFCRCCQADCLGSVAMFEQIMINRKKETYVGYIVPQQCYPQTIHNKLKPQKCVNIISMSSPKHEVKLVQARRAPRSTFHAAFPNLFLHT